MDGYLKIRQYLTVGVSLFVCLVCFFFFRQQRRLEHDLYQMQELVQQKVMITEQDTPTVDEKKVVEQVERIVSTAQLWRPIQAEVRDTVVQIFTQIAAIDILQPYKTPAQGISYGSGFFINEEGDLITNAHVVAQAKAIWVQIPSLGKRIIDVEVVGMSPERDLALLRVKPESVAVIREHLGAVPYLPLGDSDTVLRSDEVLALGYPLGQQSLKSTTGVISGRERSLIQISAPINPGSSGGPLLNNKGEVIGINSSAILEAQNVGYAIPINDLKIVLPDLYKEKILRKPFLGVFFNNSSEVLTEYLGNPQPGGCYIAGVLPGSTLDKAGVLPNDMLYELNGYTVDMFGEMRVPWSEDKMSIIDYVGRLSIGQDIKLVIYRFGERKEISVTFHLSELPAIRKIYPGYEAIDYEVFGGMVIMELTLNHIHMLIDQASGLAKFAEIRNQGNPVLVVTHILPNSQVYRFRAVLPGMTLNEVNGMKVTSLAEYRHAIKTGAQGKFLTMTVSDNVTRISDHVFVVLEYEKILQEELRLSSDYKYPISETVKEILRMHTKEITI